MGRLTHERVNGIKTGYWSAANKEDLTQRLAQFEDIVTDPEVLWEIWKHDITPNMVKRAKEEVAKRCE